MTVKKKIFILLMIIGVYSHVYAQDLVIDDKEKILEVSNEFIAIKVNNYDAKGRFSIETTGGDPLRKEDNNESLIYGRPIPWTSYTTILIDNIPYIFGSPDKRLSRRLRKTLNYGTFLFQHRTNEALITACQFDDIKVKQTITFFRNPNTNVNDSALIRYDISNTSPDVTRNVGVRMMLDTKLGQNDGSPFRMGSQAITEEILLEQSKLYDYWLTFDTLVSPNIVAQGLLTSPEQSLSMPDRLYLANWGQLVEEPWVIDYQEGRSFVRKGEKEKDTALGLYFDPIELSAETSIYYQTVYGLGGLSLESGELAVGLSMPQELSAGFPDTFLIQGYILNAGGYDSYNNLASFKLPESIRAVDNKNQVSFDVLKSGQQQQIPLYLTLKSNTLSGKVPITFSVESSTFETNTITRYLNVTPRIALDLQVKSIEEVNVNHQKVAMVFAEVSNHSIKKIKDIAVSMTLPEGLRFPEYETIFKKISQLDPGDSESLHWAVYIDEYQPSYTIEVDTKSTYSQPKKQQKTFNVLKHSGYDWTLSRTNIKQQDPFFVSIKRYDSLVQEPLKIRIEFDQEYLKFKTISPELATQKGFQRESIEWIDKNAVEITINPSMEKDDIITLLKAHFEATFFGNTELILFINDAFISTMPIMIKQ